MRRPHAGTDPMSSSWAAESPRAHASRTLRESGFDGTITVACAEPHRALHAPGPHQAGAARREAARRRPLATRRVVPRPERGAADRLEGRRDRSPAHAPIEVAGRPLSYGSLVLATGAEPRHLDFGADTADRVHVLRSFADADDIRPHLGEGTHWLVVGGGFIGAEFAASAALTGQRRQPRHGRGRHARAGLRPGGRRMVRGTAAQRGVRVCAGTTVRIDRDARGRRPPRPAGRRPAS